MAKRVTITPGFFPAPEHLLPRLDISARQHEELRAFALQAAAATIRDGPSWGRSNVDAALARGWRILSAKPTGCLLIKRRSAKAAAPGSATSPTVGATATDKLATGRSPPATPGSASGSGKSSNSGGQSLMAHSVLPYALEDVMNTLYNENTSEMRAATRRVYGDYLLDCCTLQTLEGATLDDPFWYLGLKWIALRSPVAKLVASREFVLLEHSGTHVDPRTGKRLLYRVLQSVHVRGYGGQDSYFGLTRGHIECAFVYWMEPLAGVPRTPGDAPDRPLEMLHVCMKGRLHPKGSLPLGVLYKYIKRFWKSERSVFAAADTSSSGGASSPEDAGNNQRRRKKTKKKKRKDSRASSSKERVVLQGAPLEMADVWVPDDARPRCSVCRKKFQLLRRLKHHCRACGEVICSSCTFHHALNVRDRRALSRQTLPPSALHSRPTSATSADERPPFDPSSSSAAGRNTLPSALDRESSDDVDAQVEASLELLGDGDEPDTEPAVVTVVTGKVCHRCIHGRSVIVAVRPADAAAQDALPAERSMASHGSLKSLFSTSNSTHSQLMDDADVDALLRSCGPDEHHHSQQPPPRHNYERVGSSSGSALGVWRPGQLPQQLDRVAELQQRRQEARAELQPPPQQPRLTDDLPMLLGDVEAGSILGLDESKTFLGSSGTRPSGVSRPSAVSRPSGAFRPSYVDIGVARERHEEEDESQEEDEDDDDDESSVAESGSSATSSLTSSQLRTLMDADGSASSSAHTPLRDRRNTIDELAAAEGPGDSHQQAGDEDEDDLEFYPAYPTTSSSTLTLASSDRQGGEAELDRAFAVWGFDPDCLFELRDDDEVDEDEAQDTDGSLDGLYGPLSAASSDGPPARPVKPERRRVHLYEAANHAAETDKHGGETLNGGGETANGGGKQAEVLAALSQVESALADQAALLAALQQQNAGQRP